MSPSFWKKSTTLLSMHPDLAAVSLDTDRSMGCVEHSFPGSISKGGVCPLPRTPGPSPPDTACPLIQPPLTSQNKSPRDCILLPRGLKNNDFDHLLSKS